MSDTLIVVESVSKKFCRSLKRSLWYGMQDLGSELSGHRHGGNGELRADEFWAIKDLSFEIKRGECLGLIGHNGAGKTTLLRILTGLIKPDQGRVEMRGRVGALIALGAGFNPILTGRENIYVNGSILGLSKKQIDDSFDDIVEFAELREFIETPVATYSSGMTMRLGFAVASTLNPDVLILDEVFAVGDARFRAKCFNKMHELLEHASVIFVSHNLPQVTRVSTQMLLLDRGRVIASGPDLGNIVSLYHSMNRMNHSEIRVGSAIRSIHVEDDKGNETQVLQHGQGFSIVVVLESIADAAELEPEELRLLVTICDNEQAIVTQSLEILDPAAREGGEAVMRFLRNPLNAGSFLISASVISGARGKILSALRYVSPFTVEHSLVAYAPVIMDVSDLIVRPYRATAMPCP